MRLWQRHAISHLRRNVPSVRAALQARQAEVLAETVANKRKKMNLKLSAEADKEARKDPNWKAKAFEKGGKDPARVDLSSGG